MPTAQQVIDAFRKTADEQQALLNASIPAMGSTLDLTDAVKTLDATFASLPSFAVGKAETAASPAPSFTDPAFKWRAGYVFGDLFKGAAAPPSGQPSPAYSWINQEAACYPNGDAIAALGLNASGLNVIASYAGNLHIIARPNPPSVPPTLPANYTTTHISGAINSYPFSQADGYFEIECNLPAGPGLWPAFWLLPVDQTWPPEIDVFEFLMKDPLIMWTGLHQPASDTVKSPTLNTTVSDPRVGFHTYGVDWSADRINWYVDRKLVRTVPTPESLRHRAMYIIVNMAVGTSASWGGGPDATTVFPATMRVKAIRVWKR